MKLFRCLLPLVLAMGVTSYVNAVEDRNQSIPDEFSQQLDTRDFDALKSYVNTKRTINVDEKATNLTLSGDVRSVWAHTTEKDAIGKIRGAERWIQVGSLNNPHPISHNDFEVEFNLRLDYVCDRNWAVAQIQFDEAAGVWSSGEPLDYAGYIGSGWDDNVALKKAYLGYNVYCDGDTRFDIEIGRRNLYNVFDSQVQFLSRFDGLLLKYSSSWECVADWYINGAGFVVDDRVNQFAYIVEAGLLNVMDYGLDFKYSFIDWRKKGRNFEHVQDPAGFRFQNSQFTLIYNFDPNMLCMPSMLYGAFLWNHNAHKIGGKTVNNAWYVGFTLGEVVREGDWSLDVQYQYVGALSMPDEDVSGIGRGNVLNQSFTLDGEGNVNYKGWRFEGLYALTDNITLDTKVEWSRAADKSIGGKHDYSRFQLEAIYAF